MQRKSTDGRVIEATAAEERFGTHGSITNTVGTTIEGVKPNGSVENAVYVISERVSTNGGILFTNSGW